MASRCFGALNMPDSAKKYLKFGGDGFAAEWNKLYAEGAIYRATKSIKSPDKSNIDYLVSGNDKYNVQNYAAAILDYTKAIEKDPLLVYPYYNRGLAKINMKADGCTDLKKAFDLGFFEAAAILKNNCISIKNAKKAEGFYIKGNEKNDAKAYKDAIRYFDDAIELNPYIYNPLISRGNAYFYLADYTAAIADYEMALKIDPNNKASPKNIKAAKKQIAIKNEGSNVTPGKTATNNDKPKKYERVAGDVNPSVSHVTKCVSGDCVDGTGEKTYENGDRYNGTFKDGLPHGSGTFYYVGGTVWQGGYIKGLINGEGEVKYSSGSLYKGNMVNGESNGYGKKYNSKGVLIYEGEWKNNHFNGQRKLYNNDGLLSYSGNFKDSEPAPNNR